jgi:tRNA G10  N-methylase Trm11
MAGTEHFPKGTVLLDPCGGVGTFALEAAAMITGVHAITLDNDPEAARIAVRSARRQAEEGHAHGCNRSSTVQAICADCTRCPLRPASVDCVVADMPFGNQHCKHSLDPRALLSELARVVRPGGVVLLLSRKPKSILRAAARLGGAWDTTTTTTTSNQTGKLLEVNCGGIRTAACALTRV